ncbi:CoA-disulfide reductase [Pontibacillus yanchengensis]|uniref:CoA-disulfide reductase n=1 Tax=Pontibacillus yanchengensis Y32 TaxID=1385514 RepID=A0A0A2TP21_9BACI|nr:CoA-disulfide reductase [Pontibacillus yanchengensis]KGP71095.1 CoA-disulfide reductase [Pontibacillus yanchengensis Y32]
MGKKIVIIGGVAGGATAAARLRRLDESSEIVMFERGEYISFANCGLPYYIGGAIEQRDKLLVQTVEGMSKRFHLDIRNQTEILSINKEAKTVFAKHRLTGTEYEESYDVLILSPGAKPIVPPFPGVNEKNVFTLRNIPDTDRIKSYVEEHKPNHATVVGGGFIGLEMAENLADRGMQVTVIEKGNQVMAPVDPEMAAYVHQELRDKGIELILEDGIQSIEDEGKTVVLESQHRITTSMIILSIGVQPENTLAVDADLEVGKRGGIVVNDFMQTSDPSIYAVGDAVEVKDYITKSPTMVPLAWPANRQGRIAANHIYGKKEGYNGTLGTSIVKVFDYTVATTGLNEKRLKMLDVPYNIVHIHPGSHAGYYPGAAPMAMKVLFQKEDGKILGAQIIAKDGADKRIDVIATAIKGGLTVEELTDLELAYAPPYSSAKDPVNMLGYVASNIINEDLETLQWHEIQAAVEQGDFVVDVRNPKELEQGYIVGAKNIPLDELRDRLNELPKDRTITVYCQAGLRGYLATRILTHNGFTARNLDGGWKTYSITKQSSAHALS